VSIEYQQEQDRQLSVVAGCLSPPHMDPAAVMDTGMLGSTVFASRVPAYHQAI
jgi:hypothetical protein